MSPTQTNQSTSERPIGQLLTQGGGPVANTPITTMRETITFAIIFTIIFAILSAILFPSLASQKIYFAQFRPAYQRLLAGVHRLCYMLYFPGWKTCVEGMEGERRQRMIPCMIAFTVPASSIAICTCSHAHLPFTILGHLQASYPD